MSRLKTDAIRNTSASADALTFDTNGNTKIADSEELQFGDSADLKIYHDGSNSYIKDSGTGNLVLATSELSINNAASNEEMIKASQDGSVELFHDNAKKIETIATGVNVTGGIRLGGNNAVNELDDYEEGSFTATPVTGTLNAANNGCSYIKVGRQVSLGGQIRVSGANTAALKITLPFTAAANINDDSHNFVGTLGTHSVNPPIEDGAPCAVFIDAGSTELQFVQHKGNQGWDSYSMTDGGYYRFSITYISA